MPEKPGFWNERLSAYQGALVRYFRRRVRPVMDAEDLAQEVYLRLLRTDEREHGRIDNPQAYLFTVAANLIKERAIQAARDGPSVAFDAAASEIGVSETAPEDRLFARTRERRLEAVIRELPPRYRAVLLMHYSRGMSYREIAERVGLSQHAIKKYVVHALVLCRQALKQSGHWP